jgi:hypothetical protein
MVVSPLVARPGVPGSLWVYTQARPWAFEKFI